ncbi:HNH endonuclease [candidate division WOR-3 bacterium]|nr:HNH endonuclease [candidate division WOR-3 bacterium]
MQKKKPSGTVNKACLVLNQNYEPLSITRVKRAFCLIYLGKAEVVEPYSFKIHSISTSFVAPSVLRLLYFIHVKRPSLPLTKRNILKRDNYTCQYCGAQNVSMTTDHIIPKKLGGEDSWENMVCACVRCNNKKGDSTLEKAGLKLIKRPKKPHFFFIIHNLVTIPDTRWRQYLFID